MNELAIPGLTIQDKTTEVVEELRELYRRDQRPWVVAYSGGKDSTALLQLVVMLLALGMLRAVAVG